MVSLWLACILGLFVSPSPWKPMIINLECWLIVKNMYHGKVIKFVIPILQLTEQFSVRKGKKIFWMLVGIVGVEILPLQWPFFHFLGWCVFILSDRILSTQAKCCELVISYQSMCLLPKREPTKLFFIQWMSTKSFSKKHFVYLSVIRHYS